MARIGLDKDEMRTRQSMMQNAVTKAASETERYGDKTNQTWTQNGPWKPKESLKNPGQGVWTPQTPAQAQRTGAGAGMGVSQDPYQAQANALYQQLMGRGDFVYDLQGDMLYRQYADQYSQLGRQAMMDTMGTAAGLTGGYGNSYASTVGNQAYQQYLGQLNAMVPEFYDRAYQAWLDQGNQLMQQYELAQSRAASAGAGGAGAAAAGVGAGTGGAGPFAQYVAQYTPEQYQQLIKASNGMTIKNADDLLRAQLEAEAAAKAETDKDEDEEKKK